MHQLSRADARRVAIRAQRLTAERPTDLLDAVRGVGLVQLEPTSAVAPSADLVLFSRLGPGYDPRDLRDAMDELRLVEFRGMVRVAEDINLLRPEMAAWPGEGEWQASLAQWVQDNRACRLDILDRLRRDGPLPTSELPDTCARPWRSSGWNDNRNVRMMLDLLVQRGEVAAAGGRGRDRLWDLAERIYPDDEDPLPADEARARRDARRLSALGIARARGPATPGEPLDVNEAGEPAVIEGVRGQWRVDPSLLGQPFRGRAALLSPFDRLLSDRKRMGDLFEYEYVLEMYKPEAQRRWGYYALPILYGDRLVGKLDARADTTAGVLRVHAVHEDDPFSATVAKAVHREIVDLAAWLELELVLPR
ncbi:DNA glycosylase AlkZ-like family protein [Cellulomonas sp. PhB150]|uniref:DNA glycosylase AlkZ-like family protein n=1 Tax=Cellulomonas sp. PhB150 TaxID=2485188 RepID=UPI000F471E62|nr:crosslink repair DNA glycosylase YcaQ family protein [Cellulomonas sp. PhB150]ROS28034.1 hypothetical protein EDF34_1832 [Cellulomonas sp. PhB150]